MGDYVLKIHEAYDINIYESYYLPDTKFRSNQNVHRQVRWVDKIVIAKVIFQAKCFMNILCISLL